MCYSIRVIFASLILMFFVACNNKKEEKLYQQLNWSLEQSNTFLQKENIDILRAIEVRKRQYETVDKAMEWEPKATQITSLTNELLNSIDSLEIKETFAAKDEADFYAKISLYNAKILTIDKRINEEFKNSLYLPDNRFSFYEYKKTKAGIKLIATKLKNDLLRNTVSLLQFCSNQTGPFGCGWGRDQLQPTIFQNTTHLKSGENLEISAGMVDFVRYGYATLLINNKKVTVDNSNMAHKKIKINKAPGKYKLPIKMEFKKPDGTIGSIEKEIEYIIDE